MGHRFTKKNTDRKIVFLFSCVNPGKSVAVHFRSFKIAMAAFLPLAPMIPPPGCVADPHMYRFLIGERYWAHPGAGRRKKSCSSVSSRSEERRVGKECRSRW